MIPTPPPPPGQGPIDPRGAFTPPPAPMSPQGAAQQQQQPFRGMPNPQMPTNLPSMGPQMPPPGFSPGGFPPGGGVPPWMMPPPMYYPPPPPPRGSSFASKVFVTLATTILGASLLLNIWLLAAVGLTGGGNSGALQTTVLVEGDATRKIAVIPISGVITGRTSERFKEIMRELRKDSSIRGLVLQIDTPGGEVSASDEIYDEITRFKKDKSVNVVVTMGSMATSGGYYIACASDYIFAQPTTLTGNIGVLLPSFNFSGLMEKYGVKETTITPAGSKFKNAGSPYQPESPEATQYLTGIAEDIYTRFKTIVVDARGAQLKAAHQTIESVADGRAFPANEAKKLGLVDDIGYEGAAFDKAMKYANVPNARIVKYERQPGFFEALGGGSSAQNTMSQRDINLRIDSELLNDLSAPRPMFIYRAGGGRGAANGADGAPAAR